MESVHCYHCYRFPSKELEFYISNCMHIFCTECRDLCCQSTNDNGCGPPKCVECSKTPIRLVKMGPTMPNQVKSMFAPLSEDFQRCLNDVTRVITFQTRQRNNLIGGLTKKEKYFDKLREAHNDEKNKKEQYKKQLEQAYRIIKSKEAEIAKLKEQAPPPPTVTLSQRSTKTTTTMTTPSMNRIFSDSMYGTPGGKKQENEGIQKNQKGPKLADIPPFMKSKSMTSHPAIKQQTHPPESFKTPIQPPKTSMGFTTPANPPHMFPHLQKKQQQERSKQHSQ